MPTSTDPLLQAILDDPSDLARRQVYADALQERGDPRGEFIAHHIAGRPEADALLKKHGKEWLAFLRPAVSRAGVRFINGFVERLTLQATYLDMLPAFMGQEPIREVRFRDLTHDAPRLAALPDCTRRITWLDLKHAHLSGRGFAELMAGRWDRLWRIWAPSNGLGDIGMQSLVDASPPCLRSLNLHGTRLNDPALLRLAAWPGLARIEELNLRENDVSDEAIAALLAAAPALRWLGLPPVGRATTAVLSRKRAQETLTSLVVTNAGPHRARLREIYGDRLSLKQDYACNFDLGWP